MFLAQSLGGFSGGNPPHPWIFWEVSFLKTTLGNQNPIELTISFAHSSGNRRTVVRYIQIDISGLIHHFKRSKRFLKLYAGQSEYAQCTVLGIAVRRQILSVANKRDIYFVTFYWSAKLRNLFVSKEPKYKCTLNLHSACEYSARGRAGWPIVLFNSAGLIINTVISTSYSMTESNWISLQCIIIY